MAEQSHWEGCWTEHDICRIAEINRRGAEIKRLRVDIEQLQSIVLRVADRFTYNAIKQVFDDDQQKTIVKVVERSLQTKNSHITRKLTAAETCGKDGCPVEGFYKLCPKCDLMIQPNWPPSDRVKESQSDKDAHDK